MITFLIVCCLKLCAMHLISRGYYLLEIVQMALQLIVKRTSDLNLVISDHWQWQQRRLIAVLSPHSIEGLDPGSLRVT